MECLRQLRRSPLRNRYYLTITLLLMLLGTTGLVAVNAMQHALTMAESTLEEQVEELSPILVLEQRVTRTERALYHYMVSPHPETAAEFMLLAEEVDRAFANLEQAPFAIPEERQAVSLAQREWRQGHLVASNLITATSDLTVLEHLAINELHTRLERMVAALDRMRDVARQEMAQHVVVTERAVSHARLVTAVAMVLGFTLLLVLGVTFFAALSRLGRLNEGVLRLAEGDLSARVEVRSNDEVGQFGHTLNRMAERLQETCTELKRQAKCDGLTGLYNHAEFQRLLRTELERSLRYKHPLSLLMLDVDNFKEINDRFGHQRGDEVLRYLARVLQQQSRPSDHLARYGGEEFVLLLPEIDHAGAMASAERIRRAVVEQSAAVVDGEKILTTVSIGVATFPNHAQSAEELIRRADEAMYLAKHAGRNLCISAGMEL